MWLAYDGSLPYEPVNQWTELNDFREHASTYAHQLDAAMGHHTFQSAEEIDRLTVYNTLSALIGSSWIRYDVWAAVEEEELIIGGTYDGTLLWKRDIDDYRAIDAALCGQCDIETYARRFLFHADLPAFRRLHRSGTIYSIDQSYHTLEPGRL